MNNLKNTAKIRLSKHNLRQICVVLRRGHQTHNPAISWQFMHVCHAFNAWGLTKLPHWGFCQSLPNLHSQTTGSHRLILKYVKVTILFLPISVSQEWSKGKPSGIPHNFFWVITMVSTIELSSQSNRAETNGSDNHDWGNVHNRIEHHLKTEAMGLFKLFKSSTFMQIGVYAISKNDSSHGD
jgi:hypothetical protein